MSAFKVGDVCVFQHCTMHPELDGSECTLIGGLELRWAVDIDGLTEKMRYHVVLPNGDEFMPAAHKLRLKRPPSEYDGNQAGDWSLIPWAPKRERVS